MKQLVLLLMTFLAIPMCAQVSSIHEWKYVFFEERVTNVVAGVGATGIVGYKLKKKLNKKKEEKDDNSKK